MAWQPPNWWKEIPQHTRRGIRLVAVAFTVLGILFFVIFLYNRPYIANNLPSFTLSFVASLGVSLVVFAILGFTVFRINIQRPQDEILPTKLWYLFSGKNATRAVMKHNEQLVNKLGAFSDAGAVKIFVKSYEPAYKAYRVEVRLRYNIKSLFHNHNYRDKINVEIDTDKVTTSDNILGGVSIIRITQNGEIIDHLRNPVDITTAHPKYSRDIELVLGGC